jgi:hypothetical protein
VGLATVATELLFSRHGMQLNTRTTHATCLQTNRAAVSIFCDFKYRVPILDGDQISLATNCTSDVIIPYSSKAFRHIFCSFLHVYLLDVEVVLKRKYSKSYSEILMSPMTSS